MAGWLDPLVTEDVDARRDRLVLPFRYQTDVVAGLVLTVPAGFVTDRSSVPRLPLIYLMAGSRGRKAAIHHDWLYEGAGRYLGTVDHHGDGVYDPTGPRLTRATADAIFHEAVTLTDGRFVAAVMWAGVRAGGWAAWGD